MLAAMLDANIPLHAVQHCSSTQMSKLPASSMQHQLLKLSICDGNNVAKLTVEYSKFC